MTSAEGAGDRHGRYTALVVGGAGQGMGEVVRTLRAAGFQDRRVGPDPAGWYAQGRPDLVVLDAGEVDIEATLGRATAAGSLPAGMPVIAVAPDRIDGETLRRLLRAGAWLVVGSPADTETLGLFLANVLRGRPTPADRAPDPDDPADYRAGKRKEPYPWRALVRVTSETLSLARRYRRPLAVVAFVPEWNEPGSVSAPILLAHRLARGVLETVRGDDLVGLTENGAIVAVLPETGQDGARAMQNRMIGLLREQIRALGMVADLRTAMIHAGDDADEGSESAARLLLRAVAEAG
jgi:hypothetical protein